MALQIGNAACVIGTERQRCVRGNLLRVAYFLKKPLYHCSFKKIYRSTGIVAGMSSSLVVFFVTGLLG